MSDALAALRTEAPTQETGPLPAGSHGPHGAPAGARPAPGRSLPPAAGGSRVLSARGPRDGQSLHVGRSPGSDIQLEDPSVSRRHAIVTHRGGRTVLLDDRSLNGIYVNGERVSEAVLSDGDWIAIGHVSLRYVEVTGG